ncbi:MAG TPA: hypothetical protein VF373_11630, partial [Prolixibacteraceae bacterium]
YYNEEQRGKVTYKHPESGETIAIPYVQSEMLWPALYSVLTPVCLQVADGLKILHSTSDILGFAEVKGHLEITLYGDRDLAGEIVFEGTGVKKINSATIDGEAVRIIRDEKRIALIYNHKHRSEMILNFKLS